jgi:hypothetical protein
MEADRAGWPLGSQASKDGGFKVVRFDANARTAPPSRWAAACSASGQGATVDVQGLAGDVSCRR